MSGDRLEMRQIKDILHLRYVQGLSSREIAKSLDCGKTVVNNCIKKAAKAGLLNWDNVQDLREVDLEEKLYPTKEVTAVDLMGRYDEPNWAQVELEMKNKDVTLALLWQEYSEKTDKKYYKYSRFCDLYRDWKGKLSVVMRHDHRAGEKIFVDYCDGLSITNQETGERTMTQLFVGALGASSFTFVEATSSQKQLDWLSSHVRMFGFFKGVTPITVCDNLRSGVTQACKYEPVINRSYQDLALHYGTCIIPAHPYKPRHKSKVEVAVLVAQRWILAVLRHQTFYSLAEMNAAIRSLNVKLNGRVMRRIKKSRRELYETIDLPALLPLPATPYEFSEWKKCKLGIDYHIEFDDHHYSAPYALFKKELWVRSTDKVVEIFYQGDRVASHLRSSIKWKHTSLPAHMPSTHRAYAEWTPDRVMRWAHSIGPSTRDVTEKIMEGKDHPEQGFKACTGILSLAKSYGPDRLEKACIRALRLHTVNYRSIKAILQHKMETAEHLNEEQAIDQPAPQVTHSPAHENVRGGSYYH